MTAAQGPDHRIRRILVVDDDQSNVDLLTEYLSKEGHSVTHAKDGEAALHRIRAWRPHLILLDINMPGISGVELIPKIRMTTAEEYCAIILVSANMASEHVIQGMDLGADDYVTKPFRIQELSARIRVMFRLKDLNDALRRANHRIEELASRDDLTGLLNMRTLVRKAEDELVRCRKFRKPVSALLVDLDSFKSVNEALGFTFGSIVIREAGDRIKKCVRNVDLVSHLGGDQFYVFLPETDLAGAEYVAQRINEAIKSAEIRADKYSTSITASIGVASFSADRQDPGTFSELIRNNYEAVRAAKAVGKDQIEIYTF